MQTIHCIRLNEMLQRFTWKLCLIVTLCAACPFARDSHGANIVGKAETSRTFRDQAIREIPFNGLTPEAQQRIAAVVTKPSMFRRMPVSVINCEPKLHQFLLRNPEVVINIWQLMGITKVTADRTGAYTLNAADGAGTTSSVELVYGTNDTHLFFCEGEYDGPLFKKPVQGRCVLLLKTGHRQLDDGDYSITNRMDVFLQLDHRGMDAITKTLHPLLGKSADINFTETMKFVERISSSAQNNGPGMERLASRLDKVQPPIRDTFSKHAMRIYTTQRTSTLK
ncbi:MAG: hypothetical protein KDB27_17980 [Planctomycetales bacterium]|nr:hypothetical protein [Planctomycetales bacterium]